MTELLGGWAVCVGWRWEWLQFLLSPGHAADWTGASRSQWSPFDLTDTISPLSRSVCGVPRPVSAVVADQVFKPSVLVMEEFGCLDYYLNPSLKICKDIAKLGLCCQEGMQR